jgi:hypothetical protein
MAAAVPIDRFAVAGLDHDHRLGIVEWFVAAVADSVRETGHAAFIGTWPVLLQHAVSWPPGALRSPSGQSRSVRHAPIPHGEPPRARTDCACNYYRLDRQGGRRGDGVGHLGAPTLCLSRSRSGACKLPPAKLDERSAVNIGDATANLKSGLVVGCGRPGPVPALDTPKTRAAGRPATLPHRPIPATTPTRSSIRRHPQACQRGLTGDWHTRMLEVAQRPSLWTGYRPRPLVWRCVVKPTHTRRTAPTTAGRGHPPRRNAVRATQTSR